MKRKFQQWTEVYLQLLKADQEKTLEPEKLEKLALAAYLTGRDAECFQFLERAHLGYLNREKMEKAVHCAFWLGMILMNAGDRIRSRGWFARGERILSDKRCPNCSERGLLLLPEALSALSQGQASRAQDIFEKVESIGEQFQNNDLITLGRLGHGQAMIQQGEVARGIKLLDELMISIETEEVFPLVNGIVYCAAIDTCREVWDLSRAQEWTSALTRWCEAQPDIVPFRGECLVQRAEIIQFHGDWVKALEETSDACELLTQHPDEPIAGEAFYRKAELHRLVGEFDAAEESYREAARWGRKPQPGLALLRLAQGQNDAAETSIRNALNETTDTKRRAEILPAVVKIMIAVKQTAEATQAVRELKGMAGQFDAPYLHAMSFHSQGAVYLAEGNVQPALEQLQKALKLWNLLHLPYESASTRELKGLLYIELNDRDNSDMELAVARWVFEQLNAIPDLERVDRLSKKKRDQHMYGLTLREIQVLRLVASGNTNKSVAGELFISERTVDRHVSNIFNKLGVSSRVEATTFALKNSLLEDAL